MENTENMPRPEIILVADTVAREKNIDREDVFTAMEVAIQKAGRSKYGFEHDIRAQIDRKTGAISLSRYREVVADDAVENEVTQLTVDQARDYDPKAKIGDFIIDSLPPIDFGRIAAQTAKQVITQKVREAERNRQFEEYKEKVGTIVNGTVKRIEFGNVILDIGKTEAVLRNYPPGKIQKRRPRPRLCSRRSPRKQGSADFPVPYLSGVYGQIVCLGSTGNL